MRTPAGGRRYFFPGGVVKGELLLTATDGFGFSALGLRTSLLLFI